MKIKKMVRKKRSDILLISPPFNEEDVRRGFDVMKQRHARGKVIVLIQE